MRSRLYRTADGPLQNHQSSKRHATATQQERAANPSLRCPSVTCKEISPSTTKAQRPPHQTNLAHLSSEEKTSLPFFRIFTATSLPVSFSCATGRRSKSHSRNRAAHGETIVTTAEIPNGVSNQEPPRKHTNAEVKVHRPRTTKEGRGLASEAHLWMRCPT